MRNLTRTLLVSLVAVAVLSVGVATAGYHMPPPKPGAWKFGPSLGGFSLVKKGSKLYLTNVHMLTGAFVNCPDKPEKIKVEGKFPLKLIALAGHPGYKSWGVGKTGVETDYSDSSGIVSIPAKVKANGKPVSGGAIKMDFSSVEENSFELLLVEYQYIKGPDASPCITYSSYATPG